MFYFCLIKAALPPVALAGRDCRPWESLRGGAGRGGGGRGRGRGAGAGAGRRGLNLSLCFDPPFHLLQSTGLSTHRPPFILHPAWPSLSTYWLPSAGGQSTPLLSGPRKCQVGGGQRRRWRGTGQCGCPVVGTKSLLGWGGDGSTWSGSGRVLGVEVGEYWGGNAFKKDLQGPWEIAGATGAGLQCGRGLWGSRPGAGSREGALAELT